MSDSADMAHVPDNTADMDGGGATPVQPPAWESNETYTADPPTGSDDASAPPVAEIGVPDNASAPEAPPDGPTIGEQVRAAYASGERDFSNRNLAGADLQDADLQGSNFSGADLSGANLSRANLSQANLHGASLSGAVLEHVNLSGADTSGVVMNQEMNPATPPAAIIGASAVPAAPPAPLPTGQFCAFCGTALPAGAHFCQACGKQQPVMPVMPVMPNAPVPPSVPLAYSPATGVNPPMYPTYPTYPTYPAYPAGYPTGAPVPAGYAPPSTPLVYPSPPTAPSAGYAPPSTPFVYGAPYVAKTTPLQTGGVAPAAPFRTTLTPQKSTSTGMAVAAVTGAVAVLMFFLPGYLASGSQGVSGPQLASAFSTIASACSQYSQLIGQSSGAQSVCGFASVAGLILWLEVILAAVATGIAGWQWYHQRQSGMPIETSTSWGVLITGGISLLILLYQFFAIPSLVSSATGSAAIGQAIGALFGFSFWLMVIGMIGVVVGAIMQLRQ